VHTKEFVCRSSPGWCSALSSRRRLLGRRKGPAPDSGVKQDLKGWDGKGPELRTRRGSPAHRRRHAGGLRPDVYRRRHCPLPEGSRGQHLRRVPERHALHGNPGALGPKCDTAQKICICTADPDCTNNKRGKKCDTANQMCVCAGDADCKAPFTICSGTTARTCIAPCKVDKDCPASSPKCDAGGKCIACVVDGDCASATNKYCLSGQCVACKVNGDCKAPTPFCNTAAASASSARAPPTAPPARTADSARAGSAPAPGTQTARAATRGGTSV